LRVEAFIIARRYSYARVSTADQRLDMQMDALKAAGVMLVFSDVASGARADRPGLARALAALRKGDVLTVYKLDRVGRTVSQLSRFLDDLRAREIEFRSLTEGLDTTTSMGRAIFHILSALAEMERENIIERVKSGMAAKKARGGRIGRKPVMDSDRVAGAIQKLDVEGHSYRQVAGHYRVSVSALYDAVAKQRSAGLAAPRKPSRAKPGGAPNPPKADVDNRDSAA
jgi:DNA invertase Pin-like site-specific DNA recombinase